MSRILIGVTLATTLAIAGCNPYVAAISAVSQSYGVATDERSVGTQASDAEIEGKIKADLLSSSVPGTDSISVFSRRGVVVLCGVVAPGSQAGRAAIQAARGTTGVRRVETFFVPYQSSSTDDLEIAAKVKEAFVADSNLTSDQVDVRVYNGHVVLIGVVGTFETAEQFVSDASGVGGVASVRSFIQTMS